MERADRARRGRAKRACAPETHRADDQSRHCGGRQPRLPCLPVGGGRRGAGTCRYRRKRRLLGRAVIGALFQGGKLSYSYLVDGEKIFVTAYLPTAIGVLLTLCIALFLALFLYQAALVVLFRKRGEDNAARLNAIGAGRGSDWDFCALSSTCC